MIDADRLRGLEHIATKVFREHATPNCALLFRYVEYPVPMIKLTWRVLVPRLNVPSQTVYWDPLGGALDVDVLAASRGRSLLEESVKHVARNAAEQAKISERTAIDEFHFGPVTA